MFKASCIFIASVFGIAQGFISGLCIAFGLENMDYLFFNALSSHAIWFTGTMFLYFWYFSNKIYFKSSNCGIDDLLVSMEAASITTFVGTVNDLVSISNKIIIFICILSVTQTLFGCLSVAFLNIRINKTVIEKEKVVVKDKIVLMTKEEYKKYCIANYRKMWTWIANETLKQKRCISKYEAFKHFRWSGDTECLCWCCEYIKKVSSNMRCSEVCPIMFDGHTNLSGLCGDNDSSFEKWKKACREYNYMDAFEYAMKIALLPERKD